MEGRAAADEVRSVAAENGGLVDFGENLRG
jgi:hypothetical protein